MCRHYFSSIRVLDFFHGVQNVQQASVQRGIGPLTAHGLMAGIIQNVCRERLTLPKNLTQSESMFCSELRDLAVPKGKTRLPVWKRAPLHTKIPMKTGPEHGVELELDLENKVTSNLNLPFEVNIAKDQVKPRYNSLQDPHLKEHFANTRTKSLLFKNGAVKPSGKIGQSLRGYNQYRDYIRELCLRGARCTAEKESEEKIKFENESARCRSAPVTSDRHEQARGRVQALDAKRRNWLHQLEAERQRKDKFYELLLETEKDRKKRLYRYREEKRANTYEQHASLDFKRVIPVLAKWRAEDETRLEKMAMKRVNDNNKKIEEMEDKWEKKLKYQQEQFALDDLKRAELEKIKQEKIKTRMDRMNKQWTRQHANLYGLQNAWRQKRNCEDRRIAELLSRKIIGDGDYHTDSQDPLLLWKYISTRDRKRFKSLWVLEDVLRRLLIPDITGEWLIEYIKHIIGKYNLVVSSSEISREADEFVEYVIQNIARLVTRHDSEVDIGRASSHLVEEVISRLNISSDLLNQLSWSHSEIESVGDSVVTNTMDRLEGILYSRTGGELSEIGPRMEHERYMPAHDLLSSDGEKKVEDGLSRLLNSVTRCSLTDAELRDLTDYTITNILSNITGAYAHVAAVPLLIDSHTDHVLDHVSDTVKSIDHFDEKRCVPSSDAESITISAKSSEVRHITDVVLNGIQENIVSAFDVDYAISAKLSSAEALIEALSNAFANKVQSDVWEQTSDSAETLSPEPDMLLSVRSSEVGSVTECTIKTIFENIVSVFKKIKQRFASKDDKLEPTVDIDSVKLVKPDGDSVTMPAERSEPMEFTKNTLNNICKIIASVYDVENVEGVTQSDAAAVISSSSSSEMYNTIENTLTNLSIIASAYDVDISNYVKPDTSWLSAKSSEVEELTKRTLDKSIITIVSVYDVGQDENLHRPEADTSHSLSSRVNVIETTQNISRSTNSLTVPHVDSTETPVELIEINSSHSRKSLALEYEQNVQKTNDTETDTTKKEEDVIEFIENTMYNVTRVIHTTGDLNETDTFTRQKTTASVDDVNQDEQFVQLQSSNVTDSPISKDFVKDTTREDVRDFTEEKLYNVEIIGSAQDHVNEKLTQPGINTTNECLERSNIESFAENILGNIQETVGMVYDEMISQSNIDTVSPLMSINSYSISANTLISVVKSVESDGDTYEIANSAMTISSVNGVNEVENDAQSGGNTGTPFFEFSQVDSISENSPIDIVQSTESTINSCKLEADITTLSIQSNEVKRITDDTLGSIMDYIALVYGKKDALTANENQIPEEYSLNKLCENIALVYDIEEIHRNNSGDLDIPECPHCDNERLVSFDAINNTNKCVRCVRVKGSDLEVIDPFDVDRNQNVTLLAVAVSNSKSHVDVIVDVDRDSLHSQDLTEPAFSPDTSMETVDKKRERLFGGMHSTRYDLTMFPIGVNQQTVIDILGDFSYAQKRGNVTSLSRIRSNVSKHLIGEVQFQRSFHSKCYKHNNNLIPFDCISKGINNVADTLNHLEEQPDISFESAGRKSKCTDDTSITEISETISHSTFDMAETHVTAESEGSNRLSKSGASDKADTFVDGILKCILLDVNAGRISEEELTSYAISIIKPISSCDIRPANIDRFVSMIMNRIVSDIDAHKLICNDARQLGAALSESYLSSDSSDDVIARAVQSVCSSVRQHTEEVLEVAANLSQSYILLTSLKLREEHQLVREFASHVLEAVLQYAKLGNLDEDQLSLLYKSTAIHSGEYIDNTVDTICNKIEHTLNELTSMNAKRLSVIGERVKNISTNIISKGTPDIKMSPMRLTRDTICNGNLTMDQTLKLSSAVLSAARLTLSSRNLQDVADYLQALVVDISQENIMCGTIKEIIKASVYAISSLMQKECEIYVPHDSTFLHDSEVLKLAMIKLEKRPDLRYTTALFDAIIQIDRVRSYAEPQGISPEEKQLFQEFLTKNIDNIKRYREQRSSLAENKGDATSGLGIPHTMITVENMKRTLQSYHTQSQVEDEASKQMETIVKALIEETIDDLNKHSIKEIDSDLLLTFFLIKYHEKVPNGVCQKPPQTDFIGGKSARHILAMLSESYSSIGDISLKTLLSNQNEQNINAVLLSSLAKLKYDIESGRMPISKVNTLHVAVNSWWDEVRQTTASPTESIISLATRDIVKHVIKSIHERIICMNNRGVSTSDIQVRQMAKTVVKSIKDLTNCRERDINNIIEETLSSITQNIVDNNLMTDKALANDLLAIVLDILTDNKKDNISDQISVQSAIDSIKSFQGSLCIGNDCFKEVYVAENELTKNVTEVICDVLSEKVENESQENLDMITDQAMVTVMSIIDSFTFDDVDSLNTPIVPTVNEYTLSKHTSVLKSIMLKVIKSSSRQYLTVDQINEISATCATEILQYCANAGVLKPQKPGSTCTIIPANMYIEQSDSKSTDLLIETINTAVGDLNSTRHTNHTINIAEGDGIKSYTNIEQDACCINSHAYAFDLPSPDPNSTPTQRIAEIIRAALGKIVCEKDMNHVTEEVINNMAAIIISANELNVVSNERIQSWLEHGQQFASEMKLVEEIATDTISQLVSKISSGNINHSNLQQIALAIDDDVCTHNANNLTDIVTEGLDRVACDLRNNGILETQCTQLIQAIVNDPEQAKNSKSELFQIQELLQNVLDKINHVLCENNNNEHMFNDIVSNPNMTHNQTPKQTSCMESNHMVCPLEIDCEHRIGYKSRKTADLNSQNIGSRCSNINQQKNPIISQPKPSRGQNKSSTNSTDSSSLDKNRSNPNNRFQERFVPIHKTDDSDDYTNTTRSFRHVDKAKINQSYSRKDIMRLTSDHRSKYQLRSAANRPNQCDHYPIPERTRETLTAHYRQSLTQEKLLPSPDAYPHTEFISPYIPKNNKNIQKYTGIKRFERHSEVNNNICGTPTRSKNKCGCVNNNKLNNLTNLNSGKPMTTKKYINCCRNKHPEKSIAHEERRYNDVQSSRIILNTETTKHRNKEGYEVENVEMRFLPVTPSYKKPVHHESVCNRLVKKLQDNQTKNETLCNKTLKGKNIYIAEKDFSNDKHSSIKMAEKLRDTKLKGKSEQNDHCQTAKSTSKNSKSNINNKVNVRDMDLKLRNINNSPGKRKPKVLLDCSKNISCEQPLYQRPVNECVPIGMDKEQLDGVHHSLLEAGDVSTNTKLDTAASRDIKYNSESQQTNNVLPKLTNIVKIPTGGNYDKIQVSSKCMNEQDVNYADDVNFDMPFIAPPEKLKHTKLVQSLSLCLDYANAAEKTVILADTLYHVYKIEYNSTTMCVVPSCLQTAIVVEIFTQIEIEPIKSICGSHTTFLTVRHLQE